MTQSGLVQLICRSVCPAWQQAFPEREKQAFQAVDKTCQILAKKSLPVIAGSVSLVFADNALQRELNKAWRGQDKPTNVLSFPIAAYPAYQQGEVFEAESEKLAGDIVLAYETIHKEAEQSGQGFEMHVMHLIIHGFLHLSGYTHENDQNAEIMEQLEIEIMQALGYQNPYAHTHYKGDQNG